MNPIIKRLTTAENVTAEFIAICDEATTQGDLVQANDALDSLYHAGTIGNNSVDWPEVTRALERRMFGDNPVSNG